MIRRYIAEDQLLVSNRRHQREEGGELKSILYNVRRSERRIREQRSRTG